MDQKTTHSGRWCPLASTTNTSASRVAVDGHKHVLSRNPSNPSATPDRGLLPGSPSTASWIEFGGGVVDAGNSSDRFCFDNEAPTHAVLLRPFRLADRLVTNGEWLEFMIDGGYERHEFWLSDGWARVNEEKWCSPLYWKRDGSQWREHTCMARDPCGSMSRSCT